MVPTAVESRSLALDELRKCAGEGLPYKLLILDVAMPGMGGLALDARVREDPLLNPASIMMLAPADLDGANARCRRLGIESYLVKPVSRENLRTAVDRCFVETSVGMHPVAAEPPVIAQRVRALRILLAEDNPINPVSYTHLTLPTNREV